MVFGVISGIYRRSDLMDDSAQSDNCVVLESPGRLDSSMIIQCYG